MRDFTAGTALRLGQFFGAGPELWINLQKAYEMDKVKAEISAKIKKIHQWQPEEALE